ncbi:hypothetical protein AB8O64_24280 [Streptomyces sp. QH1-20]|uniref:hypothetical protein n=1 Tax=Streptomyces sp. QH1-20 TaxID=3240934 RepID=UPI00351316BD
MTCDLYATMRERVPELRIGLDAWTRRMMRWHFSPATGSPFWLSRRSGLGFGPLTDVDGFAALALFGLFDKAELRAASARELLPRGYRDRPFRVFETGGTTGPPCRIVNVSRLAYDVALYRAMLEARGVAGGDVLAMTPSGPHAYGHFVEGLADSWRGAVFAVDFDPRWVKAEIRAHGEADAYTDHLVAQTEALLTAERPALLFTTRGCCSPSPCGCRSRSTRTGCGRCARAVRPARRRRRGTCARSSCGTCGGSTPTATRWSGTRSRRTGRSRGATRTTCRRRSP